MSKNLMDTEIGGEQTQYEGSHTFMEPHDKQAGQLGDPSEGTTTKQKTNATDEPNTQGVTKADKIRYGQSIQEGGMGGKTANSTGEANAEGGFGGTEALNEESDSFSKERREQGYGGGKDMDRNIGA
ncbi:Nn.00g093810.m01.CDS01 [Neocucurbitaria sp. VM-36]